jgi:hypothetical protein
VWVRTILDHFASRAIDDEASVRLARIALALHSRRDDLPARLDDLVADFFDGVPTDPFTGASFIYEVTVTGYRLASAGRLADDPPLTDAALRERGLVWELHRR